VGLVPEIDTLFVAGGRGTDGNQRRVYSHVLGSSLWTELPQLPADAQQTRGMGTHRGRLWVASDEGVHFFDLATRVWTSVGLPIGFQRAVSANGELWAITSTIGSGRIDVYKLVRTE
jgi:ligand-binding sensor domain-containing protein